MPAYSTGTPNISFKKGKNMRLVISENNLNKTFYENVSKSPLFYLEGLKLSVSQRIMQIPFTNKDKEVRFWKLKIVTQP